MKVHRPYVLFPAILTSLVLASRLGQRTKRRTTGSSFVTRGRW